MGTLKPCFSVSGESVECAVFELYDEAGALVTAPAPGNPAFDPLTGQPYLEDNDDDGLGERVRPGIAATIKCKADFAKHEEQNQYQAGNAPESFLTLTVAEEELEAQGLLTNGVYGIRANDRLLRLQSQAGKVRVDFEQNGRDGVYVFEVRPGYTGERTVQIFLEKRRPVAR